MSIEGLGRVFNHFGAIECRGISPLYARLALGIAEDRAVLTLATLAASRPVPNLLLSAVHFLLMNGVAHPLAAYYPMVAAGPPPDADPYPLFRAFCLEHADAIAHILHTKRVQTNEVRRCALLLPALGIVAQRVGDRPLVQVEVGASAGLNLLWDRYRYDYGDGRRVGDPAAPLLLECELRGARVPPLPAVLPRIAWRLGIDLYPVDVQSAEAVAWLRALIWPEHVERAQRLDQAVAVVRRDPPTLLAGDALDVLPQVMATVEEGSVLCVHHSFTLNQFSPQAREQWASMLAEYGSRRDLYCIGIEGIGRQFPLMTLLAYEDGQRTQLELAECDGHARWLEWRAT